MVVRHEDGPLSKSSFWAYEPGFVSLVMRTPDQAKVMNVFDVTMSHEKVPSIFFLLID
jgi:hypothetical protein